MAPSGQNFNTLGGTDTQIAFISLNGEQRKQVFELTQSVILSQSKLNYYRSVQQSFLTHTTHHHPTQTPIVAR
jgi:hypothetical protein